MLTPLKNRAREWARSVVQLYNTPFPEHLAADKKRLIGRAKTIKNMVEKVTGPLDALNEMDQLGALPIIIGGAGVAAGATAAIYKWYSDKDIIMSKLDVWLMLRDEGNSAEQSTAVVNKLFGSGKSGFGETVAKIGTPIVAVGGIFILWQIFGKRA